MKKAFLQSIRDEYPNEAVTRLVFADWCAENEPSLENKLRIHFPIIDKLNIYSNNHGHGYRNGSGYEYDGYGSGYGVGLGLGLGYGYGVGPGFGLGSGQGIPYQNPTLNMPKLHANQLIFLPYRFAFCGYISEHIQPYQFKITNASMIIIPHHSSWHEVANNTNRNINTRKFGTITIGPQIFHINRLGR